MAIDLVYEHDCISRARAVEPWERDAGSTLAALEELLATPAGRFLRELELDRESDENIGVGDLGERGVFEWALPAFERARLPQVRRLRVGSAAPADQRMDYLITTSAPDKGGRICRPDPWIGDVSAALAALPDLEDLHLVGEGVRLGVPLPATLRSLTIQTRFLRKSTLHECTAAKLPELVSLELWPGHWPDAIPGFAGPEGEAYYGPATDVSDLAALLEGTNVPSLRRLALTSCGWMPSLIAALAEAPIVEQLDVLELSWGVLESADIAPLLARADRFRRLSRLDLSRNGLDDAAQRRLAAAFGDAVIVAPQGPAWLDDEDA